LSFKGNKSFHLEGSIGKMAKFSFPGNGIFSKVYQGWWVTEGGMAPVSNFPTLFMHNKDMGCVNFLVQMADHVVAERAFTSSRRSVFFAILDRIAYCTYVLYIKNTSATKLNCIPLKCTLKETLCG